MKRRPADPTQLLIDWTPPAPITVATPASPVGWTSPPSPLVQVLPWDFSTTFPQPTDEAIESGTILDEDKTPEGIKSIHGEHAREALATLQGIDFVMDCRRLGLDPDTKKPPNTHAGKERLRRLEEEEIRLGRHFANLIGVYEDAFGADAAAAFNKAIRAWHAGTEVKIEQPPMLSSPSRPEKKRRIPAVLPVPRPLRTAIASGNFGRDEQGKPVRPSPCEVREITDTHAEKLIAADEDELRKGIRKYAGDFGERPSSQLEAYVRRQAKERGR